MTVPIFRIRNRTNKAESIKRAIVRRLKDEGMYRPDLMYRGTGVDEEGLERIKHNGTDRSYTDPAQQISLLEEMMPPEVRLISSDLCEVNPRYIWALPERGLETCIETYALKEAVGKIPVIIALRSDVMRLHIDEELVGAGKPPAELSLEIMMDVVLAFYQLTVDPIEAAVAAFRLIDHGLPNKEFLRERYR